MGKRGRPSKTTGKDPGNQLSNVDSQSPSTSKASTSRERVGDDQPSSELSEDLQDKPDPDALPDPDSNKKKSFAEVVGIQEDLNLNLSYIPAEELDGKQIIRFSIDDVIEPGKYWDTALICCILGANPPLDVVKGFLSRIWRTYAIDDISFFKEGQFIVRFNKEEDRDEILKRKYYYMDNKPVFVQKWYPGCKVDIMSRKDIPIWVQFPDLEMKYWSLTGLSKLGSAIGKPVKRDKATASRVKWSYARILVEVQINQSFPDQIHFLNEDSRIITQQVKYEWAPVLCSHCNKIGHVLEKCRKKNPPQDVPGKQKKIWKPKYTKNEDKTDAPSSPKPKVVDAEALSLTMNEKLKDKFPEPAEEEGFIEVNKRKAARRFSLDSNEIYLGGIHADLRVWIVWDHSKICIEVLEATDQIVHCKGRFVGDDREFFLSFVYAQNDSNKRKELWDIMQRLSTNDAWCVLGDFNTVLNLDERLGGNITNWEEPRLFKDCLNNCGLEDLPYEGSKYTWTNNQSKETRIYSKLDRVLGNVEWTIKFNFKVFFNERGISDHSPMILKTLEQEGHNFCFKYCDMWALDPSFPSLVSEIWDQKQEGYLMHQVTQKLKRLKGPLRTLNRDKFQFLDKQVEILRTKLHLTQAELKNNLNDDNLLEAEKQLTQELYLKMKASFLLRRQQAKADWITFGDHDSKLFYAWVKKRKATNQLTSIRNAEHEIVEGKQAVAKVLVDFYQEQLGRTKPTDDINGEIINMVACKAEENTIHCIMRALQHFRATTGLSVNQGKSEIIFGGIKTQVEHKLLQITNMRKGQLPFTYLGGPITSSRISAKECERLIEKMTSKINAWTSKNLSYAGKCKLINAVLYGIISFWSRLFQIPAKVMMKIQGLCRNFLWGSTQEKKRVPLVAWEDICMPRKYGGLGFKNLVLWNKASLMKLIWDISLKKDILWIKWIHNKYLKKCSIWDLQSKNDSCFYWKKLLHVRDCFADMDKTTAYSPNAGYLWLLGEKQKAEWEGFVWNKLTIPKHKFILWLICRGKLQTKCMLARFLPIDTLCQFCLKEQEDIEHLLCKCEYARDIYRKLLPSLGYNFEGRNLKEVIRDSLKIKPLRKRREIISTYAATAYAIWKARNQKIFQGKSKPTEDVFQEIIYQVSVYMEGKGKA
ncbi:unnamed protein product [Cuscuta campestris]|uniref:DUF4283 domain-containing protein n=1 Tax=Cuscuta campestris TaxID=132261 RepID=A0A484N3E2_9ASTE|nr:unnamed protein product [Cuscuta campestris]